MVELVITEDGSHTLYHPGTGDHYHSVHGAIRESVHIFIDAGFRYSKADPARIFEMGFGTGLNAFLTAVEASFSGRRVYYTAIEKYPISSEVKNLLNYGNFFTRDESFFFNMIHKCAWNREEKISSNFFLTKIEGDILDYHPTGSFDIIYFDAFGPDKQPGMWTAGVIGKMADITAPNGLFVTYSAKGSLKRILRSNGFQITLLPGPPGKRHITRGIKI